MEGEQLLETIRLVNGQCPLLAYHQARVDRSRKVLFPKKPQLKLKKILAELDLPDSGTHKLRLLYGIGVDRYEVKDYGPREVRKIRLLDGNGLRYAKKYADRESIEAGFARRRDCDDVLFIQHGFVTDTSYANVALFDGQHWYTPSAPMLRGTRRAKLLAEGTLKAAVIREKDLANFKKIRLINAMLPWGEGPELPVSQLVRYQ